MYELNDTIVAVSSPSMGARTIVRISGPATLETCKHFFGSPIDGKKTGLTAGSIIIDNELKVDAMLYLFAAPFSYTGDDVAEIHIYANGAVTETLMGNLLAEGLRMAGPGEFTARAYLNGKMDLAQAEAVNEVVVSSNAFQLAAAEKLLSGRLSETATKVRSAMMDCLSQIEAGLDFDELSRVDFSGEDLSTQNSNPRTFCRGQNCGGAAEQLIRIKQELEQLLAGSHRYESVVDLPAVGIAGAPNAGKSSLLNKLLGQERSIISDERKTTRDVLTGLLTLAHCRCVLFDCAGLTRCSMLDTRYSMLDTRYSILDELAQGAAIEALRNSSVVMFCVDITKEDWSEDVAICQLIQPKVLIPLATKSDLLSERILGGRLAELNKLFDADFLATSAKSGAGLDQLQDMLDEKIIELAFGSGKRKTRDEGRETSLVALTVRHRQAVIGAIENINEAVSELKAGNDEVAAMMVRAAYQAICDIQQPAYGQVDEQILERIFSRFCVGK